MKIRTDKIALGAFVLSMCLAAFVYGIAVVKYEIFPFDQISHTYKELWASLDRPHQLDPIRYENAGAKVYDRKAMSPGVTLITTFWPETGWQPGLRIIDADGRTLHHWNANPENIWPESPHSDLKAGLFNKVGNYVHGSYLFENGDVLINIEYLGFARLNACSEVIWTLPYRTHHSVSRDDAGRFWVSGLKWVEEGSDRAADFPGLQTPFGEETVLNVTPDGKIVKEISILQALFDSEYKHLLWNYQMFTDDILHLNDVEPLGRNTKGFGPLFEPGDLVISMRFLSTVAVIDQAGKFKWVAEGLFDRQHDPDFEDGGWITVFDNREDGTNLGEYLGGSAIRAIRPLTGEVRQIYPINGSPSFYSGQGGKHQLLENGNRLITEADAGRVFEIDAAGRTVWEWVNQPYDEESVTEVLEGTRYTIAPEVVASWPCGPGSR